MEHNPQLRRRIHTICFLLALIALGVIMRYGQVMLTGGGSVSSARGNPYTVERGAILDRNGTILALQTRLHTVSAWIPNVRDPEESARELSPILEVPRQRLLEQLTGSRNYVYLGRRISPTTSEKISELKADGKLHGIYLEPDHGRTYPSGSLAAHVLGHVGIDNRGLDGIEYAYDELLSPDEGRPRGDTLYGNQLVLTIDAKIQAVSDRLTREALEKENAESAMMLVMDARSGDMLAWSSMPDYDPNQYGEFDPEDRRNRPIRMMYEPGSVFKVFSVSAMLQHGATADGDIFQTDGTYRPESWGNASPITDIANYGTMDLRRVIERSSNVGVAYASEGVTEQQLYDGLKRFGFGETTRIGISGEQTGLLAPPERWSYRSKPTISMGQEVGVTALQMTAAATAFANDGVLLRPNLVRRVVSPSGEVIEEGERTPVREVISPSVARTMLDYMRTATGDGGTGRLTRVDGIEMSAKTGTAEFYDPLIRAYSEEKFVGSTLALFPSSNPEVIIYMVVENPRGNFIWGERVAAPVISEMADFLVPYLGIEREGDRRITAPRNIAANVPEPVEVGDSVPDFRGLPRRALTALHSNPELSLNITGSGWVVRQNPAPGTPVESGMQLTLELE